MFSRERSAVLEHQIRDFLGDPLELTTEVKYLFIKGELTSTDNKQKELYEKYRNRPSASK